MHTNLYFTLQADDLDKQLAEMNTNHSYVAIVQIDFSHRKENTVSNKISFSILFKLHTLFYQYGVDEQLAME